MNVMASMGPNDHFFMEWTNENGDNGEDPAVLSFHPEQGPAYDVAYSVSGSETDVEHFRWLARGVARWHQRELYDNTNQTYQAHGGQVAPYTTDQARYARGDD